MSVRFTLAAAAVALLSAGVAGVAGLAARAGEPTHDHGAHGAAMDEASMQREVDAWFATHPEHGRVPGAVAGAAVDTFRAIASPSLRFDTDGNLATTQDSVTIFVGESILWLLVSGAHTVTSGIPGQPGNGALFNVPLDALHTTFSFTFDTEGRYPFFCSPHSSTMRGVVKVQSLTGVEPLPRPEGGPAEGFLAPPAPNPAHSFVIARFALARAGQVELDVVDARGRRVARPLDAWIEPGAYALKWERGTDVPAGVYFLRLRVPGTTVSERVVVTD